MAAIVSTKLPFSDRSGFTILVLSLLLLTAGVININSFFQCDYVRYRDNLEWDDLAGYNEHQFASLLLGCYLAPAGLICLLIFAVQSYKGGIHPFVRTLVYGLLGAGFFSASGVAYNQGYDILSCGIFCFGSKATKNATNDAAVIYMGVIYFITSFSFSALFSTMSVLSLINRNQVEPAYRPTFLSGGTTNVKSDAELKPLISLGTPRVASSHSLILGPAELRHRSRRRGLASLAFVFLFLYPVLFVACTALPTWWAYFTAYDIQLYQADRPSKEYGSYASIAFSSRLVLKLFPDIAIYYSFIYAVALTGFAIGYYPSARRVAHWRPLWLSWSGVSFGEALLVSSTATVMAGTFFYWYYDHGWEQTTINSRTSAERAARSIGQVANMCIGLLTLPVTRNSAWHVVFGSSYEAMIKYHILLGYTFLALIAAHMFLWWAVYAEQGTFPHDILAVPMQFHKDNFTVPLAVVTFLVVLICMGLLAHNYVRRKNYDIFYWSHHVSVAVFLVVLWHATMSWYYVSAGLSLWIIDHVIRLSKCLGTAVHVESLSVMSAAGSSGSDIIELKYTVSTQRPNIFCKPAEPAALTHQMGQYCFVNVPVVSQLAWHPFSISSAPGDALTSHHMRIQGDGEWTGRVAALAAALSSSMKGHLTRLVVNIDGPYGAPLSVRDYSSILLVAGGIGITPMHSIYKHLFECHMGMDRVMAAHVKAVKLVWVCRTDAEAAIFQSTFSEISHKQSVDLSSKSSFLGPVFSASVYITKSTAGKPSKASPARTAKVAVTAGEYKVFYGQRPDLQTEILQVSPFAMDSLVFACGPKGLVDECDRNCRVYGVDFKKETFEL